jgi:hypothetical protein
MHNDSEVRQIEVHTAEPLVPNPSPFEVEIAIVKVKKYISAGSYEIQAKMIEARGETLWSEFHTHLLCLE